MTRLASPAAAAAESHLSDSLLSITHQLSLFLNHNSSSSSDNNNNSVLLQTMSFGSRVQSSPAVSARPHSGQQSISAG